MKGQQRGIVNFKSKCSDSLPRKRGHVEDIFIPPSFNFVFLIFPRLHLPLVDTLSIAIRLVISLTTDLRRIIQLTLIMESPVSKTTPDNLDTIGVTRPQKTLLHDTGTD